MLFRTIVAAFAALFSALPANATAWFFDISANVTALTRITDINFADTGFSRFYTDNFHFTGSGIADAFSGSGTVNEIHGKTGCGAPFHEDQRAPYQYCSFSGTLTFSGNQVFGTNLKVYEAGSGCGGFCGVDLFGSAPTFSVTYRGSDSGPGAAPVPEPATWAMMLVGFGLAGAAVRRRIRSATASLQSTPRTIRAICFK